MAKRTRRVARKEPIDPKAGAQEAIARIKADKKRKRNVDITDEWYCLGFNGKITYKRRLDSGTVFSRWIGNIPKEGKKDRHGVKKLMADLKAKGLLFGEGQHPSELRRAG